MKPEAQRIAIAEACGWKWTHTEVSPLGIPPVLAKETRAAMFEMRLPNYLTDLNAMHDAEKVLYADQAKSNRYAEFILDILEIPTPFIGTARCAFLTNHATAAQRAEAFLRTLNLWQDTAARPPNNGPGGTEGEQ